MANTTIIFDLGNVVLTNDWHIDTPEIYREFSEQFTISYDDMEKGWNATHDQFFRGHMTEEEFWTLFLRAAQAEKIDVDAATRLWRKYQKPIEQMFSLLEKLKRHYRLAVLTNIPKEWIDFKRAKYKLDNYFESIVSSGYVGVCKPDPKIYDILMKKLSVPPAACIFIDDQERNLVPARQLGMQTVLFTGQAVLEAKLRERGLRF